MSGWTLPFGDLTLLEPPFLLFLLLVPLAAWRRRRRGAPAVLFAPAALLAPDAGPALPRTARARLRFLPDALHVLALLLLALALARPAAPGIRPLATEGIDILLALDVSSSMAAGDLGGSRSRLAAAKDAAAGFIAGRPDDRIGLLTFARYPDLRCPPTQDHRALAQALAGVETVAPDGPEDATGIGTAVARAVQVLARAGAGSRVVILLTDGEETVATPEATGEIAPLHAAQLAEETGVRVDSIVAAKASARGTGTEEVRWLAERTGGAFFAAEDAAALARIYAAIDRLEKAARPEPRFELEDRFLPFLAGALALLAAGVLLRSSLLAVHP